MSRDDGFAIADMDSGYLEDAKMRDLWQRLHNTDQMARATCLHFATLLASWRQGERVTVAQACPLWLDTDVELVAALVAAKLLDRTERLPKESFAKWFGVATKRRETRREQGRLGGLAKAANRASPATAGLEPGYSHGVATLEPGSSPALPDRQTVPTDHPTDQQTDASPYPEGDMDTLDVYHDLTMYRPWGAFSGDKLKGAIAEYGNPAVEAALRAEHALSADRKTLLDRTLARLAKDADRAKEHAKANDRRKRTQAKDAEFRRRREETAEEAAAREQAHAEMKAKVEAIGLIRSMP